MTDNFQTCCRLCLSENQNELKSVFEESNRNLGLPQKISRYVSIEINEHDKISTMVCKECVTKVDNWITFKDTCVDNQHKLMQLAPANSSSEVAEMTFHIKEEPMDDSGDHSDATVATSTNLPNTTSESSFLVKKEPVNQDDQNGFQPSLETGFEDETASEISQDSIPSRSDADDIEKRKCQICEKVFSSVGNRKKHEKQIHSMDVGSSNDESSQHSTESLAVQKNQENPEDPLAPISEAEQQKILFAAGLKLLQKNSTPIAFEPLSKIELSYIEKCKAMSTMYTTLECACHQVKHPNLKGLLSHLRALRIWFPVFTCYNCMISFTDRSTFQKHYKLCPKGALETIKKLSNLRKRSEVKVRLYQNYRCTSCKFLFSFHDAFCRHIDEEHLEGGPPYKCWCTREFEDKEEYKDHVYVSCRVEYYCDICFVTTKTLDEFQKHAQEVHDSSEGFILLQDDNYAKRKPVAQDTGKEGGKEPESLVFTGKRERKQSTRMPVLFVDTDDDPKPLKPNRYLNPSLLKSKPTKCPTCKKEYTTYHNMLRHFKTAHLEQIEQGLLAPPAEPPPEEAVERPEDSYYSCPDCGGMYTTVQWVKHIQDTHEEKECEECGKAFQFETELNQHRSVHLNLKVYRDSKTKSYKSTMLSPNGEDGTDIMVMCEICDTMFTNKEDLKEHKLIHEDNSNESVAMPTLEPIEVAEKKEVKEGKYRCDPCDKTYPTYGGWWFHNKKMHNQKPPSEFPKKCDYCDKIFQTGASYFRHKQSHEKLTLSDLKPGTAIAKARRKSTAAAAEKEEESYHTCKRCFKVFSSKYNLKMHMKSHGISAEKSVTKKPAKKFVCDICQVVCENNETLKIHKETEHGPEEMPKLTNEMEVDTKPVFYCDICVGTFTTKQALKKHKDRHLAKDKKPTAKTNNSSVYCKYCKIAFGNIMELTKHMHLEHNESAKPKVTKEKDAKKDDKIHRCQVCKKGFSTISAMNAHAGWHKRNRPLISDTVNSGNTPQQNAANKLVKHAKVLRKVAAATSKASTPPLKAPEFQCTTCLAELPNDTALQVHILEVHGSVNAIMLIPRCNVCNRDFDTQEEYETHKRLHDYLEREKQHEIKIQQQHVTPQLPIAQSTPRFPKAAVPVSRSAVTVKNFPCPHCKSGFGRVDTLKTHIKMHHQEAAQTEYKCTECERVFDKQNSLSIHLKIHEKQKTAVPSSKPLFSCSICNMGFNLPKDLRMHTITAHPF